MSRFDLFFVVLDEVCSGCFRQGASMNDPSPIPQAARCTDLQLGELLQLHQYHIMPRPWVLPSTPQRLNRVQ